MPLIFLIGRILLGGFFIDAGVNHFKHTEMLTGYSASKKVPMPKESVLFSGLVLIVGGLSIILGVYPKAGLGLLILFMIVTTYMMHDFWRTKDAAARNTDRQAFMKNMAILGGLIMLLSLSLPWVASLNF